MKLKTKKAQQRAINSRHPWRVGELCTTVYDNLGEGVIYRVIDVKRLSRPDISPLLVILPTFGVIVDIDGKRPRTLDAGYCTPMSIVDLGTAYVNFGLFIAQEARSRGSSDEETSPEEVPSRDDGDNEGNVGRGDDRGLLTGPTEV